MITPAARYVWTPGRGDACVALFRVAALRVMAEAARPRRQLSLRALSPSRQELRELDAFAQPPLHHLWAAHHF